MTTFLQLHVLTSYPPGNLNRDDTGRPKTALVGQRERLRISSQALKHAWRGSDVFSEAVGDAKGTRTKRLGRELMRRAENKITDEKLREKVVKSIAAAFGSIDKGVDLSTMVFLSPEEIKAAENLLDETAKSGKVPDEKAISALVRRRPRTADIAMFGRMLADANHGNVEAAVQVAHAITVHEAVVEDDYFTAVDDLKKPAERDDTGAAHIGDAGFGAGVFYIYVCINLDLLRDNLGGDDMGDELASCALEGLIRAITTVGPRGKQASFGSRARASYCLAESGSSQPRSLAVAFLEPVNMRSTASANPVRRAVESLENTRSDFISVYEDGEESSVSFATGHATENGTATGTLAKVIDFSVNALKATTSPKR